MLDTTSNNNIANQYINTNGNFNNVKNENSEFELDKGCIIDHSNVVEIAVNCLNNIQLINSIASKLL